MSNKIKIILGVALFSGLVFAASITKFYGDIDMQSHRITYLGTPMANTDGTTKAYVDTQIHTRLNKQGGQLTGTLDMQTNYIIRVRSPRNGSVGNLDVVNKYYVNSTFLPLTGGDLSGRLNMGGNYINNVATPTNASQVATKGYVDLSDSTKLNLSGGTMSGQINMSGYRIFNLSNPIGNQDAVPKSYVDSVINNANAYQYFAMKKGSGFTPIYNLDSNTDRWFDVKVVRQFTGAITSYYENINAVATPNFPNKTWKVGETVKVLFSLGPDTFTQTNGTLVVKGPSGVLGNFGITAPPNGFTPFTCEIIINGNTYASDTAVSLKNNGWSANSFSFKIKNTSGRTVSMASVYLPQVLKYTSSDEWDSPLVSLNSYGYSVPATATIYDWANNAEITGAIGIMSFDASEGLRWQFKITADGYEYNFGQFFLPNE